MKLFRVFLYAVQEHRFLNWSDDAGQRIPCFDSCQLIKTSMYNQFSPGLPKYLESVRVNIGMLVVRMDRRRQCTVMWLPNFLGWVDLVTHGSPLVHASRARELRYQPFVPLQHSSVTDQVHETLPSGLFKSTQWKFSLSDTRRIVFSHLADFLGPRSFSIITSTRPVYFIVHIC